MFHKYFYMKKNFLLLFCFISSFVFSQEYHFDYMMKYEVSSEINNHYTSFHMINSNDKDVLMEIGQNTVTKKFYATIKDSKKDIVHHFALNDPASDQLQFVYESSNSLTKYRLYKYDSLQIERVGQLKYKIYTIKNKSIKKNNFIFNIELMPFEDNLLYVDYEPLRHSEEIEILQLIKSKLMTDEVDKNYIIKSFSSNSNLKGIAVTQKLIEAKKVNLVLTINNK